MKICCTNGKPISEMTEMERLGGCSTDHCKGAIEMKTIHIRISSPSEESIYIVHVNDDKSVAKVEYTGYLNGGGAGEVGEVDVENLPVCVRKAVEIILEDE